MYIVGFICYPAHQPVINDINEFLDSDCFSGFRCLLPEEVTYCEVLIHSVTHGRFTDKDLFVQVLTAATV